MATSTLTPHTARSGDTPQLKRAKRKFLSYFPEGFADEHYSERDYKWQAHCQWREALGQNTYKSLLRQHSYEEIALRALRIEGRTNLIFSFEKMALRDGTRGNGAEIFATALYQFLYGRRSSGKRFEDWVAALSALPRKQTRVVTWPVVTVFGFLAQPDQHLFVKPRVTRRAVEALGMQFDYTSKPNWETYESALELANGLKRTLSDMAPQDMIDVQSFLWVQGSDELVRSAAFDAQIGPPPPPVVRE
ncbi:MAG: hypothetical protein K2P70_04895 [Hyphomonadaceae bacterium]|nr:hypothetical protein [Hyphomonadaceae bacterium]